MSSKPAIDDKPKFTPGPWLITESGSVYALQHWGYKVGVELFENRFCAQIDGKAPKEELAANAHLIAAAPDMYEALKQLVVSIEHGSDRFDITLPKALSALARAEGTNV